MVVALLIILVVVETAFIANQYLKPSSQTHPNDGFVAVSQQSFMVPYFKFNQRISNDTEYHLSEPLNGSWTVTIQSHLQLAAENQMSSEAEIAFAPEYPVENRSIPAIIVQERGDGLVRVEYFPQNWPKTFGLLLYNSTSPGWLNSQNVTLTFIDYGPPSPINPQLAPRPNGNLTITIGSTVVLSNYPIAWADLSSFYVYGLPDSSFTEGTVSMYARWN